MAAKKSFPKELIRNLLPLGILCVGVAGFAAIQSSRRPPERKTIETAVPLVETVTVDTSPDGLEIKVDGLVVPYREISLAAEVAGRVKTKTANCQAGHYVTKDTLLFELDPRDYELEVRRLKLEVQQAEADLAELAVEMNNAEALLSLSEEEVALQKRQLDRVTKIFERNASSASTLDDARRAELTARNTRQLQKNQLDKLQTHKLKLQQAKELAAARLEQAELNLSRTQIVAPIDGVIISEHVEEDSFVQAGTQLVTIDDTSTAEVQCNLRVEELRWVWDQAEDKNKSAGEAALPGQRYRLPKLPVKVTYNLGDRKYTWSGYLSHYDGLGLDERTRTVPCRIVVEEPRGAIDENNPSSGAGQAPVLLRGMFVNVSMQIRPDHPLLEVPERAIRPGNVVWRYDDGKLQVTPVKIARLMTDTAIIEPSVSGLQAKEQVIVSPLAVAIDGMAVKEQAKK